MLIRCCAVVLVTLFAWSQGALAQTRNTATQIDALYQQLFTDPSNVALNLALVKAQLAARDLKGASGTLDRLLIVAPQNRDAQFLLAQVRASTGNFEEAKALLRIVLDAADSSAALKQQSQAIIDELNAISDGVSWRASVKTTLGQSYNPEGKPISTSYSLLAPSTPIEVDGQNQAYKQVSFTADIGYRTKSYDAIDYRVNIGHTRRDYNSYEKGDYEVYDVGFAVNQLVKLPLVIRMKMARHRVKDADFLDEIGLSTSRDFVLPSILADSGEVRLQGEFSAKRQSYRTHNAFGGNQDKTGYLYGAQFAGVASFLGIDGRIAARLDRKEATASIHAYHQKMLRIDTSQPVGDRLIATSFSIAEKRFDRNDPVYAVNRRKDRTLSLSLEARQSAAALVRVDGAYLALAASASRTTSNITRFSQNRGDISASLFVPLGSAR